MTPFSNFMVPTALSLKAQAICFFWLLLVAALALLFPSRELPWQIFLAMPPLLVVALGLGLFSNPSFVSLHCHAVPYPLDDAEDLSVLTEAEINQRKALLDAWGQGACAQSNRIIRLILGWFGLLLLGVAVIMLSVFWPLYVVGKL